jgi:methylthioxylose transferase
VAAALVAVLLFVAAAVVGTAINDDKILVLRYPPMHAYWDPHLGPGTPAALIVAGLVVLYSPVAARRLPWRGLLAAAGGGSLAWLWSLALVDGWEKGVEGRLTAQNEYLQSVHDIDAGNLGHFLSTFNDHILFGTPDRWPAHVAGHPPGAVLTFVGLDRAGLGGGGWAAAFCVTAAAAAAVAVLVTVRALASEELARRAAPFLVLAPAAIWLGASADAYFAAVAAWAVALLALAATRAVRAPRAAALGSGLLFGLLLYLSYGLVLMGVVGLAVLALARNWRPLPYVLAGIVPWVVAFTAAGFWWYDGYVTLVERYYQGAAGTRPYAYFVWANLAVQVLTAGLTTVAALRRSALALPGAAREAAAGLRAGRAVSGRAALVMLVAAGFTAMLAADLSGMSKAETERIWLPFLVWLLPAAALLPAHRVRWWLAAQAVLALVVNHLWLTRW